MEKMQMIQREDLKTQAKRALMQYIRTLDLEPDNKLPREEQLCTLIGVSRVTLRSALNELASEGVVLRRQGKGTFVNRTCMNMKATLNPAMHFGDIIACSGYTPNVRMVGWEVFPADEEIAAGLQIEPSTACIRAKKIFYADDRPCVYCEDILPASLWGDAPVPEGEPSLFQLIYERSGRKVAWDKVELHVCMSDDLRDLSPFGSRPMLLLKSLTYDKDDIPLFFASEYIDTQLLTLSQIRQREFVYSG